MVLCLTYVAMQTNKVLVQVYTITQVIIKKLTLQNFLLQTHSPCLTLLFFW